MTINEIVTNEIIERLNEARENGTKFYWVCPFSEGKPNQPFSYINLYPYSGINRLTLSPDEYLTYNMIQDVSKREKEPFFIRKGAKGHLVVYYNEMTLKDKETGEEVIDAETGKPVTRGFLKYYRVYCREDVINTKGENLESKFPIKHYSHEEMTRKMREALNLFNNMVNEYCEAYHISTEITRDGTQAYFNPTTNTIRIPHMKCFQSLYEYVLTVAHEMTHSTMKPLNRNVLESTKDIQKAMQNYSKEELIAEIGAEMVAQNLGIPDDREYKENSIAYLQGWASYLQDQKAELISAACKAEQATELICSFAKEKEKYHAIDEEECEL